MTKPPSPTPACRQDIVGPSLGHPGCHSAARSHPIRIIRIMLCGTHWRSPKSESAAAFFWRTKPRSHLRSGRCLRFAQNVVEDAELGVSAFASLFGVGMRLGPLTLQWADPAPNWLDPARLRLNLAQMWFCQSQPEIGRVQLNIGRPQLTLCRAHRQTDRTSPQSGWPSDCLYGSCRTRPRFGGQLFEVGRTYSESKPGKIGM